MTSKQRVALTTEWTEKRFEMVAAAMKASVLIALLISLALIGYVAEDPGSDTRVVAENVDAGYHGTAGSRTLDGAHEAYQQRRAHRSGSDDPAKGEIVRR